jgi:23S rRNA (guanosine2251-2'-O)-methyltransferase
MEEKIFGINPVLEALKAQPERFQEIFLPAGTLKGKKGLIHSLARSHNIKIQRIPRSRFEHLVGNEVHQGVVGTVLPYSYRPLEALLESWRRSQERALFVLLDGVEDPRNLGAIARTANTAGAHGIIVPKHRSAPMNAAAAKAAAGAFSYTPVCRITNLVNTIKILKKEGVWVIGAAESADLPLYDHDFNADTAVVIGGEGKGLHPLVKRHCDVLVSIPTRGNINSLNAAVATGVVLYEIIRQRREG